jgi:hypothetical protein
MNLAFDFVSENQSTFFKPSFCHFKLLTLLLVQKYPKNSERLDNTKNLIASLVFGEFEGAYFYKTDLSFMNYFLQ